MSRRRLIPTAAETTLTPAWLEQNAYARSTRRQYEAGCRDYEAWCIASGLAPWQTGEDGAGVLQVWQGALAQAGTPPSTLRQRLAAVSWGYRSMHNLTPPTTEERVRLSGRGATRFAAAGYRPDRAAPFSRAQVVRALAILPDTLDGLLAKAMLAVMVSGALRESEACALDVEDLTPIGGGYQLWLKSHKAGKDGVGTEQVAAATSWAPEFDPRPHVRAWLMAAGITAGPLFRGVRAGARAKRVSDRRLSTRTVDRVMQRIARALGLTSADVRRFKGHTPRTTWVTAALAAGVRVEDARRHSRHATVEQLIEYGRAYVGAAA